VVDEKDILRKLAEDVILCNPEGAREDAKRAIELGISAYEAIDEGLIKGMTVVGEKYESKEYFVPDLMAATAALNAAFEVLKPYLKVERAEVTGKVVIGCIKGNIQDIGKNIVAIMLTMTGFKVYDVGPDVPPVKFIDAAKELNADIIAVSVTMLETIPYLRELENGLRKAGIRDNVKLLVGGKALSEDVAKDVGADAYGKDAREAVEKAIMLLVNKKI